MLCFAALTWAGQPHRIYETLLPHTKNPCMQESVAPTLVRERFSSLPSEDGKNPPEAVGRRPSSILTETDDTNTSPGNSECDDEAAAIQMRADAKAAALEAPLTPPSASTMQQPAVKDRRLSELADIDESPAEKQNKSARTRRRSTVMESLSSLGSSLLPSSLRGGTSSADAKDSSEQPGAGPSAAGSSSSGEANESRQSSHGGRRRSSVPAALSPAMLSRRRSSVPGIVDGAAGAALGGSHDAARPTSAVKRGSRQSKRRNSMPDQLTSDEQHDERRDERGAGDEWSDSSTNASFTSARYSSTPNGNGRRGSITAMLGDVSFHKGSAERAERRKELRESVRTKEMASAGADEDARIASVEAELADERAKMAARTARRALDVAARQEWEMRAINFLAAGNAKLPDGTLIKTWLDVHEEIARAKGAGVPLSKSARVAMIKMGMADRAIKNATMAAKQAAERAYEEWASTRPGARGLTRELTSAARALALAEKAEQRALEAEAKALAREQALHELQAARRIESNAYWGWGSLSALARGRGHRRYAAQPPPPPTTPTTQPVTWVDPPPTDLAAAGGAASGGGLDGRASSPSGGRHQRMSVSPERVSSPDGAPSSDTGGGGLLGKLTFPFRKEAQHGTPSRKVAPAPPTPDLGTATTDTWRAPLGAGAGGGAASAGVVRRASSTCAAPSSGHASGAASIGDSPKRRLSKEAPASPVLGPSKQQVDSPNSSATPSVQGSFRHRRASGRRSFTEEDQQQQRIAAELDDAIKASTAARAEASRRRSDVEELRRLHAYTEAHAHAESPAASSAPAASSMRRFSSLPLAARMNPEPGPEGQSVGDLGF